MTDAPAPETRKKAPDRAAPLALWRVAEALLGALSLLFGGPGDIARRGALSATMHKRIARWIRAGEALLRRLLLIEARKLGEARERPASSPPGRGLRYAHARRRAPTMLQLHDANAPAQWPVSFRMTPHARRRRRGGSSLRPARLPATRRDAWPLAQRYEALIRVFNAPLPYARRLARRLARDATVLARVLAMRSDLRVVFGEAGLTALDRCIFAAACPADTS